MGPQGRHWTLMCCFDRSSARPLIKSCAHGFTSLGLRSAAMFSAYFDSILCHRPERSGLSSGLRGAAAVRFGLPSAPPGNARRAKVEPLSAGWNWEQPQGRHHHSSVHEDSSCPADCPHSIFGLVRDNYTASKYSFKALFAERLSRSWPRGPAASSYPRASQRQSPNSQSLAWHK